MIFCCAGGGCSCSAVSLSLSVGHIRPGIRCDAVRWEQILRRCRLGTAYTKSMKIIRTYFLSYIWSKMLSSPPNVWRRHPRQNGSHHLLKYFWNNERSVKWRFIIFPVKSSWTVLKWYTVMKTVFKTKSMKRKSLGICIMKILDFESDWRKCLLKEIQLSIRKSS